VSFLGHHKIDSLTNAAVCITTSELYGAVVGTFRILLVRLLNAISHVAVRQAVVNQIHLNSHAYHTIYTYVLHNFSNDHAYYWSTRKSRIFIPHLYIAPSEFREDG